VGVGVRVNMVTAEIICELAFIVVADVISMPRVPAEKLVYFILYVTFF
jgi:hypothetical protein